MISGVDIRDMAEDQNLLLKEGVPYKYIPGDVGFPPGRKEAPTQTTEAERHRCREAIKSAADGLKALDPLNPATYDVAQTRETIRSSVLNEANKIVNGARNQAYGSAEDNFQNIANLWNGYLGSKITPVDVANMMALMKIARLKHSPDHRDSWVDIAGYAACGAECGLKAVKNEACGLKKS